MTYGHGLPRFPSTILELDFDGLPELALIEIAGIRYVIEQQRCLPPDTCCLRLLHVLNVDLA
ncbi:MAG: hypothetical protein CL424_07925 [Acidimicrobiaceae bacterium]|nr:hypothetical protein [Acidimicrobiaceae bacterium]